MLDGEVALQLDVTGDPKHDGPRALGVDGGTQTAGTGVVEVGDLVNRAAAASDRVFSVAFGGGKSELALSEGQ